MRSIIMKGQEKDYYLILKGSMQMFTNIAA